PLMVFVRDRDIEVQLGPIRELRSRTDGPLEFSLSLAGATTVAELKAAAVEAGGNIPLASLEPAANTNVAGTDAPVGRFAPDAIPSGFVENAGVVFFVPKDKAVDVDTSMKGVADPFRNKGKFYASTSLHAQGRTVLSMPGDQYSALHL